MEERHLERQLLGAPERLVGPKADVAVLVVVELAQRRRHADLRRLVGLGGKVTGPLADVVESEGQRGGRGEGAQERDDDAKSGKSGRKN